MNPKYARRAWDYIDCTRCERRLRNQHDVPRNGFFVGLKVAKGASQLIMKNFNWQKTPKNTKKFKNEEKNQQKRES